MLYPAELRGHTSWINSLFHSGRAIAMFGAENDGLRQLSFPGLALFAQRSYPYRRPAPIRKNRHRRGPLQRKSACI